MGLNSASWRCVEGPFLVSGHPGQARAATGCGAVLSDGEGIPSPHLAAGEDCGIDTDVHLVVLRRSAQDARIRRQVALGERCHHAPRAWPCHAETDPVSERKGPADPSILD